MSQQRLAREVGLHYTALSRIEAGRLRPTVLMAIRIAKALHAPVDKIWEEEEGDL